jgi:hypothetical protein
MARRVKGREKGSERASGNLPVCMWEGETTAIEFKIARGMSGLTVHVHCIVTVLFIGKYVQVPPLYI